MRELSEPAALFLLVQMDDHIQLVARSDRAAIDVGSIAQALGGGGHATASAAVLRERDLKKAKALGAEILQEKTEIPGRGWYGIFKDPTGNTIGLFTRKLKP